MSPYEYEEKENFNGQKIKVLGPTYEEGRPEGPGNWREKLTTREDMVKYLRTALRYWYSDDEYGSEKRRKHGV